MSLLAGRRVDPPLHPSPDDARALLRRELLRPEYRDQQLVERFTTWLRDRLADGLQLASASPPLATFFSMVILVLLVVTAGWLLSRLRSSRARAVEAGPALTGERVSADELRRRAEAALAEGRSAEALVEGFRALAVRQVERGRIDDLPGATAHELAGALAEAHPPLADRLAGTARTFDQVLYGDRPAERDQAQAVLALDDDLAGVRR